MRHPGTPAWESYLSELETWLAADGHSGRGAAPHPPADPGPVPQTLRPRAEALLGEIRRHETAMSASLAEVRRALDALPRRPAAATPDSRPHYLDARA